ncbi:hypothetical protein DL766_003968 [Monosporascus sp. MC13-8B]|uniref:BZIP domain-containing protein n=1 Tax=Monosporascus cannonballus TaxID=155416 RepID=A0ABY0H637_9PEZI|nr:hypothetical protein DL762_004979 [Monosporascus cannonballus]RYP32480.1 hypothetical protein DL766_003968 [Monosporascus sp. MC13-8B]
MCSPSQEDLEDLYERGEAPTLATPSEIAVWQADESHFNPLKEPDNSFVVVASATSADRFDEPIAWAENGSQALEDALRDELYFPGLSHTFNTSTVGPDSFAGASATNPPSLVHQPSTSSPTDVSYPREPGTLPSLKRSQGAVETKEVVWPFQGAEPRQPAGVGRALTHRERNRIAAHKCRQKNRQNVEELQQQERDLAQQNRYLNAHLNHLKEEVLGLRNEILNHGNCDCELIQHYIAESARNLRP